MNRSTIKMIRREINIKFMIELKNVLWPFGDLNKYNEGLLKIECKTMEPPRQKNKNSIVYYGQQYVFT